MFGENLVSVGFVVGLDYENPHLSPFEEMQRYKTHPAIRPIFEGGRRIAYGARALSEGGFQSIPKLVFPGGALIGDTAGFLNVPKIKGTHTAMKSGHDRGRGGVRRAQGRRRARRSSTAYPERLKQSWLWDELRRVRNIRPAFHWGLWPAMAYSALDTYVLRGKAPWTLAHRADHTTLKPAADCQPIDYPRPDGKLTFDKLSSVFLSNTNHEEDQPVHLRLKDPSGARSGSTCRSMTAPSSATARPASTSTSPARTAREHLQINAQNCVHCKTCDIKDPTQNIDWVTPEGGGGPNYIGGM